jgi:hypothetical protein
MARGIVIMLVIPLRVAHGQCMARIARRQPFPASISVPGKCRPSVALRVAQRIKSVLYSPSKVLKDQTPVFCDITGKAHLTTAAADDKMRNGSAMRGTRISQLQP